MSRLISGQPVLPQVMHELYVRKLDSLMVEGGGYASRSFSGGRFMGSDVG